MGERIRRFIGVVGVALRRTGRRLRGQDRRRFLVTVLGVAIAIALVITVTGVSIGLATNTTVYGSNVDYWIVPETASASTMAVSVGGPSLGQVHPTSERIERMDGVDAATPVSIDVARLTHGETSEYVVLVGVVAKEDISVLGVDTGGMVPGDPLYAKGSYDGSWTGELVASPAVAELLAVDAGDDIAIARANETFTVHSIGETAVESGAGNLPTAVVHIAEAQLVTGQAETDAADQILVRTQQPGIKEELAGVYPNTRVVAQSGPGLGAVSDSELPLAVAITAFLVATIVGSLFIATAMGMEVTGDRRTFATLQAIGFSRGSQFTLVTIQTITVTVLGGLFGVGLGVLTIRLVNVLAQRWITDGPIAVSSLYLVPYGIGLAVVMGLLAVPYLAWLLGRTETLAQLEA